LKLHAAPTGFIKSENGFIIHRSEFAARAPAEYTTTAFTGRISGSAKYDAFRNFMTYQRTLKGFT